MPLPSVLAFGEALCDRLGPMGADFSSNKGIEDCIGGAPANVVCALARLGIDVGFCGRIGKDDIGNKINQLMTSRGVNITCLQEDQKRPTRIVLVKRDIHGERSFEGFHGDEAIGFADQHINLEDLKASWGLISQNLNWLVIGSIPLASDESSESLIWLVEKACESGIKIAIDINWRAKFWDVNSMPNSGPDNHIVNIVLRILSKVSLIKLSNEEANWFFKTYNPSQISKLFNQAPDVVITNGSKPIKWNIANFVGEKKIYNQSKVIDTTGAGDAFTAGLIYSFLNTSYNNLSAEKVTDMISFASAAGALVCQGAGAIDPQPTKSEIYKYIQNYSGL